MGYASSAIQEGNVDDGFSSAMYDAQFKPSSTNLPALGSTFAGYTAPTTSSFGLIYPSSAYNTPTAPAPAPTSWTPITSIIPTTTAPAPAPTPVPIAVSPYGTGTVTGIVTGTAPAPSSPIAIPTTIQDSGTGGTNTGYVNNVTPLTAQNNATTLQQQSGVAAAAGNSSLAAALAAQAKSWQGMANGLAQGSVVSPLSADPEITTSGTSIPAPTVKAGISKYALLAGAAALFFLMKK
jgi:hypothetical protein